MCMINKNNSHNKTNIKIKYDIVNFIVIVVIIINFISRSRNSNPSTLKIWNF